MKTNELARHSDEKNGLSRKNTIKIVTQKVRSNSNRGFDNQKALVAESEKKIGKTFLQITTKRG
jgi:hypothetical protein